MTYNLIFAEKIEALTEILSINDRESIEMAKNKIREEIQKGLSKENILNEEDKILLYKFDKPCF